MYTTKPHFGFLLFFYLINVIICLIGSFNYVSFKAEKFGPVTVQVDNTLFHPNPLIWSVTNCFTTSISATCIFLFYLFFNLFAFIYFYFFAGFYCLLKFIIVKRFMCIFWYDLKKKFSKEWYFIFSYNLNAEIIYY